MLKPYTRVLPIAAALAFVASAAMAESTSQGTVPHTTTTIGVTPQDAQEAMEKASPNAETGTLVRTEPSIEKRARSLTKDATTTHTTPPSPAASPANKTKNHTTPRPAGIPANKTTGTVTNTTTPNAAMGITGTVPGADDTTGDVTNTHDNAQKNKDRATGAPADADAMGNYRSSPPSKP